MSAYRRLPALLRRIDALESGAVLCRRPNCYERLGLFSQPPFCGFCSAQVAFRADLRFSAYLTAQSSDLNPFIRISSAC